MSSATLLEVDDLHVEFQLRDRVVKAARGVSFELNEGETLVVVGESGCGKTVSSLAVMGLLGFAGARVTSGSIRLRGRELVDLPASVWRSIRARRISMVFQDPQAALNPVFTVGWQIAELFRVHAGQSKRAAYARAIEQLERVKVPDPAEKARSYPHELSGGMRQRALLAMALALSPEILIADEPTSALDATVTKQIIELLRELGSSTRMGTLLVTHDVDLASELADRVAVMYAGRIVESGRASTVLGSPAHPYTVGLLAARPRLSGARRRLATIPGAPPSLDRELPACPFALRCSFAEARCHTEVPEWRELDGRRVACHFAERVVSGGNR